MQFTSVTAKPYLTLGCGIDFLFNVVFCSACSRAVLAQTWLPGFRLCFATRCRGGPLFDRIVKKGTYSEMDAARDLRKMLEDIKFLHSIGIAHRDIKRKFSKVRCILRRG
mmetsp:Transcript_2148/g.8451  ORF Transcript_2148/g.8451 Transcript_2148/m.8451 type:complete len:110 (+) Transcript_2148:1880-2209(+)